MPQYIYEIKGWPAFKWNAEKISLLLSDVRYKQGRLIGRLENLGFNLQKEAMLQTITQDVIKSSEIEGEFLDPKQVRSSIAKRLGFAIKDSVKTDRNVDGVVEMMLNATQKNNEKLSKKRLLGWQSSIFPVGRSGLYEIITGAWRDNEKGPMQVVSGAMGRERVHFRAPDADVLEMEMKNFINWFNTNSTTDAVLKAAIAHLWFVTIHPFDDGNGRIARALTDMLLSRADNSQQRFYSMSAQIKNERKTYYTILEKTQKGTLDITHWLEWFLACLERAITNTDKLLADVLQKAKFWDKYKTKTFNDRQHLMLNKLLDKFEGKLTSSKWALITKSSQDTAMRDIQDLLERKILVKGSSGGRSTSYLLKKI